MSHKPSSVMADRDGEFQRCWDCGARRRITGLGPGLWDKGHICGPEKEVTRAARATWPTQQKLIDELFKQT